MAQLLEGHKDMRNIFNPWHFASSTGNDDGITHHWKKCTDFCARLDKDEIDWTKCIWSLLVPTNCEEEKNLSCKIINKTQQI